MEPRSWLGFPIVDPQRSSAFLLLLGFNDIFGMSLMFFLSGLFVWRSLERKGASAFLRDRVVRLGGPFVVSAVLVPPLAYYPSYLVTSADPSVAGFRDVWLSMGLWPGAVGPAWFLWVLLVFDTVAAALFARAPGVREILVRVSSPALDRPAALLGVLVVVSACVYVPLAIAFGPGTWNTFGPFTLQSSRVLHYLVYFLAGTGVGIHGIDRGLLAPTGALARRWTVWLALALAAFGLAGGIGLAAVAPGRSPFVWGAMGGVAFAVSCAASSFAVLAVFVRFVRLRRRIVDGLEENAYGMYLIHFPIVGWLQYALLPSALSGFAKGSLVFLGTVMASWAASAAVRRVPGIARVL